MKKKNWRPFKNVVPLKVDAIIHWFHVQEMTIECICASMCLYIFVFWLNERKKKKAQARAFIVLIVYNHHQRAFFIFYYFFLNKTERHYNKSSDQYQSHSMSFSYLTVLLFSLYKILNLSLCFVCECVSDVEVPTTLKNWYISKNWRYHSHSLLFDHTERFFMGLAGMKSSD